jgi:hypothetical protein
MWLIGERLYAQHPWIATAESTSSEKATEILYKYLGVYFLFYLEYKYDENLNLFSEHWKKCEMIHSCITPNITSFLAYSHYLQNSGIQQEKQMWIICDLTNPMDLERRILTTQEATVIIVIGANRVTFYFLHVCKTHH